jgi:hypothetical protein
MISSVEHPAANLYRVEVSGWDDNKAFFVENSELEWPHPVAYEAELVARNEEGLRQFRLRPLSSRGGRNPELFQRRGSFET